MTRHLRKKIGYSGSGPRLDVYAPGTGIVSATSQTNVYGATTQYPLNTNFKIMDISGTSMASPNVAGVAAQLLQLYPTATPAQIRQKIIDLAATNQLYSTGGYDDWGEPLGLHGGANRYVYQSYNTAVAATTSGALSGLSATISTSGS